MNKNQLTLGSLFSGSGGFELAGSIAGIKPLWNSEVEPFPIAVTCKRFPDVKHYGDVSGLSGADLEPVDIITFGSPCTDLSIAGKRAGLDGEHSGLFHQAIRIIREMREKTDGRYPRYAVWENVFGAFSSHQGEDFRAVLDSFIQTAEPEAAPVPMPEKGSWPYADVLLGDGWSVAYRTFDSQWWGVPQRRRRIYLVADFAGRSAGEVLFESEGLSGYTPQGFRAWQGAAGDSSACPGEAGGGGRAGDGGRIVLNDQGGQRMDVTDDVTSTLRAEAHHPPVVMEGAAGFCTEHSAKSRSIGYEEERSPTLRAGVVPAVQMYENHSQDTRYTGPLETAPTVSSTYGTGGNNQPFVTERVDDVPVTIKIRCGKAGGGKGVLQQTDLSATLGCNNDQTLFVPEKPQGDKEQTAFGISSFQSHAMLSDNPHSGIYEADTSRTLDAGGGNPSCNQGGVAVVGQEREDGTVAFTQNQRDEVRDLGSKSGSLQAQPGMKQQTYVLQGNMIGRNDKNGPQGCGISEDVCYTLTDVDRHAVATPDPVYAMTTGSFTQLGKDVSPTLLARDYKDPTAVAPVPMDAENPSYGIDRAAFNQGQNAKFGFSIDEELSPTLVSRGPNAVSKPEPHYTVRRLTPTECARLQGFPDDWCHDLGNPNPTDEEVVFWTEVWETHRKVVTHASKPKTEKLIRKWLADPYTDSAEYKLWGNGISLPVAYFVMCGIVWAANKS